MQKLNIYDETTQAIHEGKQIMYYLNNYGSRWKIPNEKITVQIEDGKIEQRTVIYWEAIGNFVVPYVSLKGKKTQLKHLEDNIWIANI